MSNENKNKTEKIYWKSIEQLTETAADLEASRPEFAEGADLPPDNAWSRRSFMSTIAAGLALAGLSGCRKPVEKIVPYVSRPEIIDPGTPLIYATTVPTTTGGVGILVRCNDGRPTHIEGNPIHPSSGGAVNPQIQASLLDLYDPDRSKKVLHKQEESSWDDFVAFWKERHAEFSANEGAGLAVLCEPFASPTKYRLMTEFKKKFPKAYWLTYEPNSDENIVNGLKGLLGKPARPIYKYDQAKIILALDADFLATENDSITATAGFAKGRRVESKSDQMNRLYVAESRMSVTGAMADHRLRVKSVSIGQFVVDLAVELISQGLKIDGLGRGDFERRGSFDKKWLRVVATDLISNYGSSLVVVGAGQPALVHAMVGAINTALGSVGKTVTYVEPKDSSYSDLSQQLSSDLNTLVIIGSNPAYNGSLPKNTKNTIHLSLHIDETSNSADWHIPATHYMESWSDVRSLDGTPSVVQPLIAPLFDGHADVELMSLITNGVETTSHEIVQATWSKIIKQVNFESDWQRVLHDGVYVDRPLPQLSKINSNALTSGSFSNIYTSYKNVDEIELVFITDKLSGGKQSNNGWLQELPDPITMMVWDNAALISPVMAESMSLENGDIVTLSSEETAINIPVWISPGQADKSIAVALGYGRKMNGRIADEVGTDVYPFMSTTNGTIIPKINISKTGRKHEAATTQKHNRMEGRPLIRENTLSEYKKTGEFFPAQTAHPPLVPLWEPHKYDEGNQWGMTVDLNACTGCGACTISCQSENNIPVVGKDQVNRGREMHWIRIDRYFAGSLDEPEVVHQPVMCQHCENAPCEAVCPVSATVHDAEGLNVMVYNRCIGTRYCSNNCPYKVRRFNFYNFTKDMPEVEKMSKNPEVTIRSRGVMEKCTYCVQRINNAKSTAKLDGREMADGDVVTACQSSCPANAISFGNIIDPNSEVAKLKKSDRNYAMLEELNILPRTTYLAKLRNPNPSLEKKVAANSSQSAASQGATAGDH